MLVGEDNDVVFKNDQEVADLLAVVVASALVAMGIRVTPEGQERAFAQLLQVPFGWSDRVGRPNILGVDRIALFVLR